MSSNRVNAAMAMVAVLLAVVPAAAEGVTEPATVRRVVVSIPEELETGFMATLPEFLADAYGAEE